MITGKLESFIANLGGNYSIVLRDLNKGQDLYLLNPEKLIKAASTVKIPIMMEIMAKVSDGKLDLEMDIQIDNEPKVAFSKINHLKTDKLKLRELLIYMMSISDNTATNILIELAGMDSINNRMKSLGIEKTILKRKMMDFASAAKGLENYTGAIEIAKLLEMIYSGSFISKEICGKMVDYMSTGIDKDFMDRYLPKELKVAHKTGELDHMDHDCGIVYLKDYVKNYMKGTDAFDKIEKGELGDYILVMLGEGFENNIVGREKISKLSEFVFNQSLNGWS